MQRPTLVRYRVLVATALVSVFMYVDRACLSQVIGDVQKELHLTDSQKDWALGSFFFSYAVVQVFAGALALRFGLRNTFAVLLFLWSAFTVMTGLATGFGVLLASRLLIGASEAGAYPIAATLVRNWFPVPARGVANSVVAFGGRLGGALSLLLTPVLVRAFAVYPMAAHGALAGGVISGTEYDPLTSGWRPTLQLFGYLGMGYAVFYWFFARDSAAQHPRANAAEVALVPHPAAGGRVAFPWVPLLGSVNLWFNGLTQFCINIGWAFLLTKLGEYLEKGHGLTGEEKGFWSSLPLFVGLAGMFAGGFVTDALSKRVGLRWGRALPIGVSLFACAGAFSVAALSADYRVVVGMLCVVAVCVDVGIPAIWAFAQDIGGRHTGAALGWANMWGNIGAGFSPVILGGVLGAFGVPDNPNAGWPAVFVTCAVAFVVAGLAALQMNATVPLVKVKPATP